MIFDWSDLAFASKKPLKDLKAIFIAAPREISSKRFTQLIKEYLPQGNIILGIAKEEFIHELEDQPQFKTLTLEAVAPFVKKVNAAGLKHTVTILQYSQRDLPFILEKLEVKKALFINGSWYHAFHLRPEYYQLAKQKVEYELISPFVSEAEAKAYAATVQLSALPAGGLYSEEKMLHLGLEASQHSFAYSEHQTGLSVGRKKAKKYELLELAHNSVVPYETYAMHHGASREINFSPMNDLNHYDVVHAEVMMMVKAQKKQIDLQGATLFINLLPCPSCARMLCETDIAEIIYQQDHSDGYAVKLLEKAGKKVRRLVI